MSATARKFSSELDELLRIRAGFAGMEHRMSQSLPGLAAAAYDTEHGGTVVWCDVHERTVTECHRLDDIDGERLRCVGVPLPKVTDPTGDKAASTTVFAHSREVVDAVQQLAHARRTLARIMAVYADSDALPADRDRVERDNMAWCERHLRYGHERASRTLNGTKVRRDDGTHILSEPRRLCAWCETATKTLGRLPTEQEIMDNVNGKRLRVPA